MPVNLNVSESGNGGRKGVERHLDDSALSPPDVEGYLDAHSARVAIDEAQRLPELFPALRRVVDRGRGRGRYLLLGSASPALVTGASETLAGRIGFVELTPFLCAEILPGHSLRERWFHGGFPPLYDRRRGEERNAWLDDFIARLNRELMRSTVTEN